LCSPPTFPTPSTAFLPSITSDIQYFLNCFIITAGEVHCHGLGMLAQQFYTRPLLFSQWYQNMVPSEDPVRIHLFEMFLKRSVHSDV
jgi:hypothetical protein